MNVFIVNSNVDVQFIVKAPDPCSALAIAKHMSISEYGFVLDGLEADLIDEFMDDYDGIILEDKEVM